MATTTPIRILQFGTTGQLAGELVRAASARPRFTLNALSRTEADFRYPEQVFAVARASEPVDLVVNAAAYTAVDKAESEPDIARYVNTESVGALARACAVRNIPLLHISTDYVFDGAKLDPYTEEDQTRPLGVYGRTKLEGESAIRVVTHRHIIIRTSWVYSARGANFVRTMLRLGSEREELRIVDDQRGAPTAAADLAGAILTIAERLQDSRNSSQFGTFHYADEGETTWRRFAEGHLRRRLALGQDQSGGGSDHDGRISDRRTPSPKLSIGLHQDRAGLRHYTSSLARVAQTCTG